MGPRAHSSKLLAALLPIALGWCAAAAHAADCANPRKAAGSMSESVYRGVEGATKLIAQKQYNEAID